MGLDDRIVLDKDRLLSEAKSEVIHMSYSNYTPPRPEKIYVGGRDILVLFMHDLFQMHEAGHITAHDLLVGKKLSWILSGGDITASQWVDEQYILDLERTVFSELIALEKTVNRIIYTLKTGKRLRN
jgi:3-hydroxyacyl-CoA dehydrogenase